MKCVHMLLTRFLCPTTNDREPLSLTPISQLDRVRLQILYTCHPRIVAAGRRDLLLLPATKAIWVKLSTERRLPDGRNKYGCSVRS